MNKQNELDDFFQPQPETFDNEHLSSSEDSNTTVVLEKRLQQVILKAFRGLNERLNILETLYFNERNNEEINDTLNK
ncbi:hypothetical protein ABK040_007741 [Willaertia magna]